jgi:hypothetical protein
MNERLPLLSVLAALLLPVLALGQSGEPVPYVNVSGVARATGEFIAYKYLPDGGPDGCTSQVQSRVPNPPTDLVGTECVQSKVRARNQLADAIDAGALLP